MDAQRWASDRAYTLVKLLERLKVLGRREGGPGEVKERNRLFTTLTSVISKAYYLVRRCRTTVHEPH